MFKGTRDVFNIVVNFISSEWEAKHVTIGLFEVIDTRNVIMAPKLQELLDKFSLTTKILTYVRDKGSNLQTCANAFTSIVLCNYLGLLKPFYGSCLGHALLNVCQYAITDEKVVVKLSFALIKVVQSIIQKCIT
jgi:hypothetical protein